MEAGPRYDVKLFSVVPRELQCATVSTCGSSHNHVQTQASGQLSRRRIRCMVGENETNAAI